MSPKRGNGRARRKKFSQNWPIRTSAKTKKRATMPYNARSFSERKPKRNVFRVKIKRLL
jgi:hypothetical protein